MFRKYTLLVNVIPVLFVIGILSSSAPAIVRPAEQADPIPVWDEGRPIIAENMQNNTAIPAVATAAGTLYRTFSGTRFQPTTSELTFSPYGGAIYATALPAGGVSFSMELDLPSGAEITEVVFFVIDNDATKNMDLSLRSYRPEINEFNLLASASSSGASSTLQVITAQLYSPVTVDNTTTSYRLRVVPGVASIDHLLRGARIGYTVPISFLPLVTR